MKESPFTKKCEALASKTVGVNLSALSTGSSSQATSAPSAEVLASLDEATWQQIIIGFAVSHGWEYAHCRKVQVKRGKRTWWETTMPTGWFDLVLARDSNRGHRDSLYFVELKVAPNVQTEEQKMWEKLMTACGQTCFLWYPKHWEVVQRILSRPVEE